MNEKVHHGSRKKDGEEEERERERERENVRMFCLIQDIVQY